MRNMETMLLEFHSAFGALTNLKPTVPDKKHRVLRHRLVIEELQETYAALGDEDFPEFVDGLIDSLYVLVGTNVSYGLETVEPKYGIPSHAPTFPSPTQMTLLDGMIDGMWRVADTVLDYDKNPAPELPVVAMCMNKLISDCLCILYLCGVDAMDVFLEVHLANMRKLDGNGLPIRDKGGKVIKPEGWVAPDIQRVLDEQTRRFDYPTPGVG